MDGKQLSLKDSVAIVISSVALAATGSLALGEELQAVFRGELGCGDRI